MKDTTTNIRLLVLETLLEWERTGVKSSELTDAVLMKYADLSRQQRSFYKRLTGGTIEQIIRLDDILDRFSKTPAARMKPEIRNILRLSLYQLREMDAVPDSAVVNEAVKLARKKGFGTLTGFVNGVLRGILRDPERARALPSEPAERLRVQYSMPAFLIRQWIDRFGEARTESICASFLTHGKTTVRIRGENTSEVLEALSSEGVTIQPAPFLPFAYRISGYDSLPGLKAFQEGRLVVQDVSSMLAVCAAGLCHDRPYRILDVCASPGGKSLLAADLAGEGTSILSRDISGQKMIRLEENCTRLGFSNIRMQVYDAACFDPELEESMDVVLADVPCTGYGVIGRKPDIKYNASPEKQRNLAFLQQKILETAAHYVKPGGVLIYSTCTISEEENEENIRRFLEKGAFTAEDLRPYLPAALVEHSSKTAQDTMKNGYLQLLPDEDDCDGFFIARMIRNRS